MSLRRKPPLGNVRRVASIGNNARGCIANKAGRLVQFESFAERSLLLRLERDATVRDYASQPETFRGPTISYTPDFIVWRCNRPPEIHEVTRSERRELPSAIAREALAFLVCQERGWLYVVHTEQTLPYGSELSNLSSLFRYRVCQYDDENLWQVIERYLRQPMQLARLEDDLIQALALPQPHVAACLCHWIWHGRLQVNWQQTILIHASFGPGVTVELADGGTSNE
jgi:hypothetical protein